jgi:hypothetical protein
MKDSNKIACWSGPRNVSTALMYSFAQRKDLQVWDEPFFGYFLKRTEVWRPSREEVLRTMETSWGEVMENIEKQAQDQKVFLKNMANHLEGLPNELLNSFSNIILTRDPKKVLASYTKHIEQPTLLDLGYTHQLRILEYLKASGQNYLVVDSDEVCEDPERELKRICDYLKIEFDGSMLKWEAGARPEDGIWAKYWYQNVHKSTGFKKPEFKEYKIEDHLTSLYKEALQLFNKILKYK